MKRQKAATIAIAVIVVGLFVYSEIHHKGHKAHGRHQREYNLSASD